MTQTYHFGAETHLDAGDTSAFVMPSAAISRVLPLTFVAIILVQLSRKAHKDSDTRDRSRSLTLTCETHCAGEDVSTVIISCLHICHHC